MLIICQAFSVRLFLIHYACGDKEMKIVMSMVVNLFSRNEIGRL